jgi:hypothetical protein
LLSELGGLDYKKTIAEVVTKDYLQMLKTFREDVALSNAQFKGSLAPPQIDRTKIGSIQ